MLTDKDATQLTGLLKYFRKKKGWRFKSVDLEELEQNVWLRLCEHGPNAFSTSKPGWKQLAGMIYVQTGAKMLEYQNRRHRKAVSFVDPTFFSQHTAPVKSDILDDVEDDSVVARHYLHGERLRDLKDILQVSKTTVINRIKAELKDLRASAA